MLSSYKISSLHENKYKFDRNKESSRKLSMTMNMKIFGSLQMADLLPLNILSVSLKKILNCKSIIALVYRIIY